MEGNNTDSLRVFVTSATEGLGRAVTRQLVARGHTVTGMAQDRAQADLIRADGGLPVYNDLFRASEIASTLKMVQADVIVNTTPQSINGLPIHDPDWDYYRRLLTDSTTALVQAAAQAEAKFVVHTSYAFLYGDTHGEAVDESAPLTTGNALFKAAAEAETTVLKGAVPGCVLRAGFNYGPGSASIRLLQHKLINRGALAGINSDHLASWVHGADLATAVVLAAEQQPAGDIFNVADDEPVTVNAFVDDFADSMSVARPTRRSLPSFLEPFTTTALSRALMATAFQVNTAKAKAQLGWSPAYPDHESGMEQTLLTWRAAEAG